MHQPNGILPLTINLLANGAFSHLKDDDISALHRLIMKLREPVYSRQQNQLLAFWNHADAGNIPSSLLYRCNTVLQQLGCCPIEEWVSDVEMY